MTEEEGAPQSPDANSDKKAFGKDVGKLVSGTVVAQVVGICLIPIITRIFSPDIYGLAAIFISIVSILTVVSCLRYELAILLPKDDKDAGSVFCACLAVLFCFSIVLIPVFFFFGDSILSLFKGSDLSPYVMLIPLLVFIDGLYLALRYWNTRKKRFGTQAATQVVQSLSGNGLKLGFGLGGMVSAGSLIVAQIIGQTLGTLVLFFQMIRYDSAKIRAGCSFAAIKTQMVRYKKFPLIDSGSNLMNVVSWQLPVLMLSGFFSTGVAGLYSLGFQMIQLPMSFIGGSIRQVFLQRSSVAKHEGKLPALVEDACSVLIMLSVMPFLLLTIVGGDLFALVFGSEWYEAGVFAQILGMWAMIWFVASIMSELIYVLEFQEFGLLYNILNLSTRFLSLLIGGLFGSVYLALFLFMVSGICVYGYMGYTVVSRSKASLGRIWILVRKQICIAVILAGIVLLMGQFIASPIIVCGAAILLGVLYMIHMLKTSALVKAYVR
ncbi:MAG: oligosaccharide flippase family protein [Bacteroidales bacterium]|nr:oligosaccharide flippase family protein [Bacteroidales bacterium]